MLLTVALRSPIASTLVLIIGAAFAGLVFIAMRNLGITRDHPLVRSASTRPWRTGRDVFRLATSHLSEVFIITPKGSLLAPHAIEVRMNPADLDALTDVLDLDLVNELAVEAYEAVIASRSARVLGDGVSVSVVADPEMPAGRYVTRQQKQLGPKVATRLKSRCGITERDLDAARTMLGDDGTLAEGNCNPTLRLVTGDLVTQTRMSDARAGRGQAAELTLPQKSTVSRVHARFTCVAGQWHVSCVGRNGLLLNGEPLADVQPVRHGDFIRWGQQSDSPTSRVEILPPASSQR
jgi:hypothetical protein